MSEHAATPAPTSEAKPASEQKAVAPEAAKTEAAPATSDAAKEMQAVIKRLDAAEKRAANAEKRLSDPEFLHAEITKRLGVPKNEDPVAMVNGLRSELGKWQGAATKAALKAEAFALLPDAHNPARVLSLLDTSGVEFDVETGTLKGADVLKDRVAELRVSDAYLFKSAEPKKLQATDQSQPPVSQVPKPVVPSEATDPEKMFVQIVTNGGDLNEARKQLARMNTKRPFALMG